MSIGGTNFHDVHLAILTEAQLTQKLGPYKMTFKDATLYIQVQSKSYPITDIAKFNLEFVNHFKHNHFLLKQFYQDLQAVSAKNQKVNSFYIDLQLLENVKYLISFNKKKLSQFNLQLPGLTASINQSKLTLKTQTLNSQEISKVFDREIIHAVLILKQMEDNSQQTTQEKLHLFSYEWLKILSKVNINSEANNLRLFFQNKSTFYHAALTAEMRTITNLIKTISSNNVFHYAALTAEMRTITKLVNTISSNTQKLIKELQFKDETGLTPVHYLQAACRLPQIRHEKWSAKIKNFLVSQLLPIEKQEKNFHAIRNLLIDKVDWLGKTALHWAARYGDAATIEEILAHPKGRQTAHMQDIFGKTPLTLALQEKHKHKEAINVLKNFYDPKVFESALSLAKPTVNISQSAILKKFTAYYALQGRETTQLCQEACWALSFLFAIHEGDVFFSSLEYIASWDEKTADKELERIFEYWISSVNWFQKSLVNNKFQCGTSLKDQLAILRPDLNMELLAETDRMSRSTDITFLSTEELERIFNNLLEELPNYQSKIKLILFGSRHAVAVILSREGLEYYDCNLETRVRTLTSTKELAELVRNTKYRMLNFNDDPMEIFMLAFIAQNKTPPRRALRR